jgi:FecR protein
MTPWRLIGIASVLLAAALSVPAWGADPGNAKANAARPGSLNYVEGQASIEGQNLGPEAIGKTELNPGQSLETQAGKVELLLTPGVFFRLGDNSSVTMISPSLIDTELRLNKGEATVEVAALHPENNLVIAEDGAKARLTQTGFYDFDADRDIVRVYQGQANVQVSGQDIEVKKEHQLAFKAGRSMKPEKFDKEQVQDDLYRWSSLRSSYIAEANVDRAQVYPVGNWYGAGWDWDPYYGAYTFIPGDGIFYSPFGWGFYSPFDVGFAPIFFFGHFDHDFDRDFRHFGDRDHDRDHFADRGHGDREHGDREHGDREHGDRGHFGDGDHHEAHYYNHFDHGAYHGPGHSDHSGFAGGGVVAAGSHAGFHGGEGFHGGPSGDAFHGGGGSIGSHGMGSVQGGGAGHLGGGAHAGGGVQRGGGFHGGGGGGGGHH